MKANKTRLKYITSVNRLTYISLANTIPVWCHGITQKTFMKWFHFIKWHLYCFPLNFVPEHTTWALSLMAEVSPAYITNSAAFQQATTGVYCRKSSEDLKTPYPRYEKYFAEVQNRQNLKKTGSFQCVLKVVHVKRKLCGINEINNFP